MSDEDEFNSVNRGTSGAEFYKADLHLHTPASNDYKEEASPEQIVEKLKEENIQLVAITDHDKLGDYDEIRETAEEENIAVLPGAEITTPQGSERQIHMTAIFPPEKLDQVEALLYDIGINPASSGPSQADQKISAITKKIKDRGGLAVLAHIDEKAGADYEIERNNALKKDIFNDNLDAVEIVYDSTTEEYDEYACISSSDAHELEDIGRGYCFLKMTRPSFEGLRLALADPESRISLEKNVNQHQFIQGLRINGSFFDDIEARLNPNLNCLIGGKGTGKSTVIELIRYTLDKKSNLDRIQEKTRKIVEKNLAGGGSVELHVIASNGDKYIIKRSYEEDPVVYRPSGEEVMDIESFKGEFFDVEIFGQMELLKVSRDEISQMKLLDSYFDLNELKQSKREMNNNLEENRNQLKTKMSKKEKLEKKLKDFDTLKEKINYMEREGVDEYLENEDIWEREKKTLKDLKKSISESKRTLKEANLSEEIKLDNNLDEMVNPELVENSQEIVNISSEEISEKTEVILEILDSAKEGVSKNLGELKERNKERKEKLEKEKIEEETGVDIYEYINLKEKKTELEDIKEKKEKLGKTIEGLKEERKKLKSNLEKINLEIREVREKGISRLSNELENVHIELKHEENLKEYLNWIKDVLSGQNIRTQDKEKLAEIFPPEKLKEIVSEEEKESLKEEFTDKTSEKIIDTLIDKAYQLDEQEIKDSPEIMLEDGDLKKLEDMSDGQRCTTLLSIAMLERNIPLIIDQPEDQLDNEFVYTDVVKIIRKIKNDRQIISATHNANIPVLGDSEQILILNSNGYEGYFTYRGSIEKERVKENAQDILEGGEAAFEKRTQKYGLNN